MNNVDDIKQTTVRTEPALVPKKRLTTSAMIASIASEGQRTTAAPFGKTLVDLARDNASIVGLTADLAKYTDLHLFKEAYPERFYQMGMAEQLLVAAAGGMAKEGLIPIATTYAVFATRRAYDFIHQVIAEENLNVKLVCALPGLTSGYGPSHQAAEDVALMRAIPNMTVLDPCDAVDIEQMTPAMIAHNGPVYMRLLRGQVPRVLDEYNYTFELGKAKLLRGGRRVAKRQHRCSSAACAYSETLGCGDHCCPVPQRGTFGGRGGKPQHRGWIG
jgi:transketolase